MTNREAFRRVLLDGPDGPDICEWDPLRQMPARLKDGYHGLASVDMIAIVDGLPCRVCAKCAELTSPKLLIHASIPAHLRPASSGHVRLCGAGEAA